MFRKRKKLFEDFKVIFAHYTPEEQIELGASLMLDSYFRTPERLSRAMGDIEVARLAKRTEELHASAQELFASFEQTKEILGKIKEKANYEGTDTGREAPDHSGEGS